MKRRTSLVSRLAGFVLFRKPWIYFVDACCVLAMIALLYYGSSWEIAYKKPTDASRYQCYGLAFWHGIPTAEKLHSCGFMRTMLLPGQHFILFSQSQILSGMESAHLPSWLISFVAAQSLSQPFHALPLEYPFLVLIPFSLALLVPTINYQLAFAVLMILIAVFLYAVIYRFVSRWAAFAYGVYSVAAGWSTVAARFDIFPSALVFLAIILAERKRWNWAYSFLALGTLCKFYPVVLLPFFFLAQQQEMKESWISWDRWRGVAWYAGICVAVVCISLLFNVEGTLAPLSYFSYRPIQIESVASSVIWLVGLLGIGTPTYVFSYGSLNIESSLASPISTACTVLLGIGLLYCLWLQWKRKVGIARISLFVLLIIIVTGKVFSPQYLIWIIPLLAYIGKLRPWWFFPWVVISGLTVFIYPHIYLMNPDNILGVAAVPYFFPVLVARNVLLCVFFVAICVSATRRSAPLPITEKSPAEFVSSPFAVDSSHT